MIKASFKKIIILGIFFSIFFSLGTLFKVEAAYPPGCNGPFGVPAACPSACDSQKETGCYVPDFKCVNAKFLNPQFECCDNKCNGEGSVVPINPDDQATLNSLNIFGTKFSFSPDKIPSLINIAISTFLGFVSLYALIRGMYVGAIIRAGATSADDIAKANKEIINLIIGFVLAWSFIFIIQFVANLVGIGSISDLNVTNTGSEITIT